MSARTIPLHPVLRFPRVAQAGRRYTLTVDLRHSLPPEQWPYEREEYPLTCLVESLPLFEHRPLGTSTLILHRFGGTYGEVRFVLEADQAGEGRLRLLFVNESGLPVHAAELPGIRVVPAVEIEPAVPRLAGSFPSRLEQLLEARLPEKAEEADLLLEEREALEEVTGVRTPNSNTLSIEMLPAQRGDCLWIEYGDPHQPHRILVDCGSRATYRELAERLREQPDITFELLVLTHIDADHILGGIPLLQEFGPERFGEVWFNGWRHLPQPTDVLRAQYGEIFSALLSKRGFLWNWSWDGEAVVLPDEGPFPRVNLPGGMTLTLLSPLREGLADLLPVWNKEIERLSEPDEGEAALEEFEEWPQLQSDIPEPGRIENEALAESSFQADTTPSNGSSIAFLAEYDGKAILLGADALSPVLEESIRRLLQERDKERLHLDACKIPHHRARNNNSPGFFRLLACRDFLISTDGSRYQHPHPETIARILTIHKGACLHFNYRSAETEVWDDRDLKRDFAYEAYYSTPGIAGYRLRI